jgi:lysophospholipase L1-like esterase
MESHKSQIFAYTLISCIIILFNFSKCTYEKNKESVNHVAEVENDLQKLSAFADTMNIRRFQAEIDLFILEDSNDIGRKIDILFTGSSSIRRWQTLKSDFRGYKVLNRGFGGSTIPEIIYYSDILIFRHNPDKIVFYAGENDIAQPAGDTSKVIQSFIYFQKLIKTKLNNSCIYFISLKPSPSRIEYWPKMQTINQKIKQFCDSTTNCTYIDVSSDMLDLKGNIRKELFDTDNLHLNQKGYANWREIILKTLKTQNK